MENIKKDYINSVWNERGFNNKWRVDKNHEILCLLKHTTWTFQGQKLLSEKYHLFKMLKTFLM